MQISRLGACQIFNIETLDGGPAQAGLGGGLAQGSGIPQIAKMGKDRRLEVSILRFGEAQSLNIEISGGSKVSILRFWERPASIKISILRNFSQIQNSIIEGFKNEILNLSKIQY